MSEAQIINDNQKVKLISSPFVLHVQWRCPDENALNRVISYLNILAECQKDEAGVITYAFWRSDKNKNELEFLEIYNGSKSFWRHSQLPEFADAFAQLNLPENKESTTTKAYGIQEGIDVNIDLTIKEYLNAEKPNIVNGSFWGRSVTSSPILLKYGKVEISQAESVINFCLTNPQVSACLFDNERGFIICSEKVALTKIKSLITQDFYMIGNESNKLGAGYIHRNFTKFSLNKQKNDQQFKTSSSQEFYIDKSGTEPIFHFRDEINNANQKDQGVIPLRAVVKNFTQMNMRDYISAKYLYFILGRLRHLLFITNEYNNGLSLDPIKEYSIYHHRYLRYIIVQLISGFGYQVNNAQTKIIVPGLDILIQEIENIYNDQINSYKQLIREGNIVFNGLQELYRPGVVVRGMTSLGVPAGFKVGECYFQERKSLFGFEVSFHLRLHFAVLLGEDYAIVEFENIISRWVGESGRKFTELYFAPADQQLLNQFNKNGKKYLELTKSGKPTFLQHDAGCVFLHSNSNSQSTTSLLNSKGRILIDVVLGSGLGHHASRGQDEASQALIELTGRYKRFSNEKKSLGAKIDNPDYMFLIQKIPEQLYEVTWPALVGFSFTSKSWCHVLVGGLNQITFNDKAFDELVLDQSRKRLIQALVRFGGEKFEDIIQGKSGGSIFLLHGPPGIGKTLTAEAIAEVLHRPLYYVTMGELGTDPETMEKRLGEILTLCASWDALVLIDEADVFLEKRSTSDVLRNAMVCVMLRMLEYHQGILFLTTNRVTEFDPAFESRVTIALKYNHLTESARSQIWKNLINRLECEKSQDLDYGILSKHVLNGRQIKNAIRLAVALSLNEKKPLDMMTCEETLAIMNTGRSEMEKAQKF